jgi:hypothetical protein
MMAMMIVETCHLTQRLVQLFLNPSWVRALAFWRVQKARTYLVFSPQLFRDSPHFPPLKGNFLVVLELR